MYLRIEELAEQLQVEPKLILRLITEGQIKALDVDGEIVVNSDQFDFYLKQKEQLIEAYEQYLHEPILEDVDVKDED